MTDATWQLVTTAPNPPAAHAIATLLRGNGVPCQLQGESVIAGDGLPCAILVEASLLHRAQRILADARLSDAELEFLATGMLCCDDAREKP